MIELLSVVIYATKILTFSSIKHKNKKMRLTLLSILLTFLSFFNGNAQFVSTYGTSSPTACDGYAYIQDSNSVTSVLNWTDNSTIIQSGTYSISNLCQGTYTVSFNTLNGTMTETFTIGSNSNPCANFVATFTTTDITDPTVCDGSATIAVTGGSAPYAYNWSNMNNYTPQAMDLCSGFYTVSVTDNMGCVETVSFNIVSDSLNNPDCTGFYASMSTTDASSSSICDGTYAVSVFGGTAPYTFSLANGMTGQTASDLCTGTYTVFVSDNAGCTTTATGVIGYSNTNPGDTIIFTGTIFNDSSVVGTAISDWIDNCTFDFNTVVSANVDSYISFGDSTLVTWEIGLSNGTSVFIDAIYQFNAGNGIYNLILQLVCGQKDNPKYLQINSQINYQLVGISENENAKFQLFPNPVQDELTISGISEASTYEIIDRNGRLILTGNLSVVETKINVTNLYNGNYLFVISSPKRTSHYNFVK